MFSYVTALVFLLFGYSALDGIPTTAQAFMFGVMAILLFEININPSLTKTRYVAAIIYGVMAPLSFLGVQKWNNYHGTTSLGPWMALWDLALAIAILTLEDT